MVPAAILSEEMMEQLEARGAHDELIQHWGSIENKAFPTTMSRPLPLEVRGATLRFMRFLTETMDLAPSAWFRAAVLLDAACLKVEGGLPLKDLPTTAAALVVLVKKADTADFDFYGPHLQAQIMQLHSCFTTLGYEAEQQEITANTIHRQELALMALLRWQVNVPSIESWLSVFCTRLMLMSDAALFPCLQWVWRFCTMHAEPFVLLGPAWPTLKPRNAAQGLLCVGLLAVGLMSLDSMSPSELELEAWESIFQQFQRQQSEGLVLQKVDIDHVETATCSDLATLHNDLSTMLTLLVVPMPQQQPPLHASAPSS